MICDPDGDRLVQDHRQATRMPSAGKPLPDSSALRTGFPGFARGLAAASPRRGWGAYWGTLRGRGAGTDLIPTVLQIISDVMARSRRNVSAEERRAPMGTRLQRPGPGEPRHSTPLLAGLSRVVTFVSTHYTWIGRRLSRTQRGLACAALPFGMSIFSSGGASGAPGRFPHPLLDT
jgi:hypothetical protein